MTIEQAVKELDTLEMRRHAYGHAQNMLGYDAVTGAPKGGAEARGRTLGILSEDSYKMFVNDKVHDLLLFLNENKAALDEKTARRAYLLLDEYNKTTCIPMNEYVDFTMLLNDSDVVWHEAKEKSDYALFKPCLKQIVDTLIRFAGYKAPDKTPYNATLDDYEKGFTTEILDGYFADLKKNIVPLVKAVGEKEAPKDITGFFPIEKQRILSDKLMQVMGIDRNFCAIAETEHPFTDNFSKYDVRITTHYLQDNLISSMYSVIHEGGHALYELHVADDLQYTCLGGGVSMGVHESQSRFYENIIGRSRGYIHTVYPIIYDLFRDELKGCTEEQFYRAVNKAVPSLVRTEADELTYSLHIMVRYELEKALFDRAITVDDLPHEWNRMYKEYLGVTPKCDREGVLQDSHWSGGALGYFPSYSLGSAYGAQMLHKMEQEFDVWGGVNKGDLTQVSAWLENNIHRFGCLYDPAVLLQKACGEPFKPAYYSKYLKDKFTEIYSL